RAGSLAPSCTPSPVQRAHERVRARRQRCKKGSRSRPSLCGLYIQLSEPIMSNDTASIPGEDLRDLGIDAPAIETTPAQDGGEVHVGSHDGRNDPDEARGRKLRKADIEWALGKHGDNVSAAARQLGVTRPSLYRAMERVGVRKNG